MTHKLARTAAALAVVLAPALPLAVLPAMAQDQKPATPPAAETKAEDVVVATVNGQKIMRSDVEFAAANLPPQYRQMPLQLIYPALLDQLIDGKLMSTEGRKLNLQSDPEVKKRLAMIEDRLIQDAYLQREVDKKVTPAAMKDRYEKLVKDQPAEEEVKARHILVKTEAEAKQVIAELKKGGDFDKIAKEKSTDKGSGAQGGDLGWFKKGDMVAEFADSAFKMKKGETSATPVKTQFGFHVIRVEDRRTAPPPTFEESEDEIRAELSREAVNQIVADVRGKSKIERFNLDGSKIEEKPADPAAKPAEPAKPADKK